MAEHRFRLLFDENLAARLVTALGEIYPDSTHVGAVSLAAAADRVIWEYARDHDFVIVSKDEDFLRLSVLRGPPPKVIWIRLGNCSTADIIRLLTDRRADIEDFATQNEAGFLALG